MWISSKTIKKGMIKTARILITLFKSRQKRKNDKKLPDRHNKTVKLSKNQYPMTFL